MTAVRRLSIPRQSLWTKSLLGILFVVFFLKSTLKSHYFHERTDLLICTKAATNLWNGLKVYDISQQWAHTKPPFATLAFLPLTFLPESILFLFWDLLNLSLFVGLAKIFSNELKKYYPKLDRFYFFLVAMLSCINFWGYELRFGQYNLLGLAMLWAAGRMQSKNWIGQFVGAALFWMAFFLKPSNLLLLPWVLNERKCTKIFLKQSLAFLLILSGLYSSLFGLNALWADNMEWLNSMPLATQKYLMRDVNFGFPLFFGYFTMSSIPQHFMLLAGLFLGFFWKRLATNSLEYFGVLSALSLMVSPMTWWATFTLLMPLSTYLLVKAYNHFIGDEKLKGFLYLVIVYLGTQFIFPYSLPGFLRDYPRLANPNWVYLSYILYRLACYVRKNFMERVR